MDVGLVTVFRHKGQGFVQTIGREHAHKGSCGSTTVSGCTQLVADMS